MANRTMASSEAQTAGDAVDHAFDESCSRSGVFGSATPSTAQLVVIRGRYMPSAVIQGGHRLLQEHLNKLDQSGDDQDKGDSLHVAQVQLGTSRQC